MALRSGRIKSGDVSETNELTIIRGGRSATFRIYNSGETNFIVKPNGANTPQQQQIVLKKKCSVDIEPNGDVIITQNNAEPVEGIYEYIDPLNPIRSGRFKGDASGNGIVILQWKNASQITDFYRILNSGDKDFIVNVDGNQVATLKPTYSIDVFAGKKVGISRGDAEPVEGIYDYLHPRNEMRNGRFKIKKVLNAVGQPVIDPRDPHPIINLSGASQRAWYRIFNSGEHAIIILEGNQEFDTLEPDQSLDFEVGPNARRFFVKAGDLDHIVDGSYEFLGKEP
jgi:hypothetical protein